MLHVTAGDRHTAVITAEEGDDGRQLWTWGGCETGQLGHGGSERELIPRIVDGMKGRNCVLVSAGSFHTTVVTDNGEMLTTGYGGYGQLGHGDSGNGNRFKVVEGLRDSPVGSRVAR